MKARMKTWSLAILVAASSYLISSSAGASANAGHGTVSGTVSQVSTKYITVKDSTSHQTLRVLIVPTDGYGVLSPDGKTTHQMSAIKVGWHVKVDYDQSVAGKRHADHVFLLR